MNRRSFFSFSLAALSLALLASCTPTPQAPQKVTVVLDWTINTNHTGLYVAQAKGYFKELGLEVAIEAAPETGAAALLAAGKADLAYSYQEEILQSRAAGVNLTAVAAVIQHNTSGFAARSGTGITRPRDFVGKKYGGWGSLLEEAVLKALVSADGGDPAKVEILNIGSMDFFAATEKVVDFAWIFEGWTAQEAKVRGISLNYLPISQFDIHLDYYTPVLAANQKLLDTNPELVKKMLKAISRGYQDAIAHPDEAAEILLKAAPELNADLVLRSQKFLAAQYQADAKRWGEMDSIRWQGFFTWMRDNKLINLDPALGASYFTNSYLP